MQSNQNSADVNVSTYLFVNLFCGLLRVKFINSYPDNGSDGYVLLVTAHTDTHQRALQVPSARSFHNFTVQQTSRQCFHSKLWWTYSLLEQKWILLCKDNLALLARCLRPDSGRWWALISPLLSPSSLITLQQTDEPKTHHHVFSAILTLLISFVQQLMVLHELLKQRPLSPEAEPVPDAMLSNCLSPTRGRKGKQAGWIHILYIIII